MSKVLILLCLTIPLACSLVIAQPSRANEYVEKGRVAYERGDVQTALQEFQEALSYDNTQPNIYTYLGNIYFIMGNYEEAEDHFTKALLQYYKNARTNGSQGTIQGGGMILLDPKENASTTEAMLLNNRGAARYRLGDIDQALADFQEALELQPGLEVALINWETIEGGEGGRVSTGIPSRYQAPTSRTRKPINSSSRTKPGTSKYNKYTVNPRVRQQSRPPRPESEPRRMDSRTEIQMAEDVRESRLKIIDMAENGGTRGGLFAKKPFEKRKVSSRGKVYRKPMIKAASQDYIFIEEVKITPTETRVKIRVENHESRRFSLSVNKPSSEDPYYITDRSGSRRSKFKVRKIEGIAVYPKSTELKANSSLVFTLVFGKIPDTMGYINILEGKTQDGSEWNFYGVDLAR